VSGPSSPAPTPGNALFFEKVMQSSVSTGLLFREGGWISLGKSDLYGNDGIRSEERPNPEGAAFVGSQVPILLAKLL